MIKLRMETGWGAEIIPSYDPLKSTTAQGGWGIEISDRNIQPGGAQFEFGVYEDGNLLQVLRTDIEKFQYLLIQSAKEIASKMQKGNPSKNYEVRPMF